MQFFSNPKKLKSEHRSFRKQYSTSSVCSASSPSLTSPYPRKKRLHSNWNHAHEVQALVDEDKVPHAEPHDKPALRRTIHLDPRERLPNLSKEGRRFEGGLSRGDAKQNRENERPRSGPFQIRAWDMLADTMGHNCAYYTSRQICINTWVHKTSQKLLHIWA